MKIILTWGLVAAGFVALANTSEVQWNKGSIVLDGQEVYTGEFNVQPIHNIVLLRCQGKVTVYPAHKFRSLYLYDAKANINRRYISEPVVLKGIAFHQIYEVVLRGEIVVLRQQKGTPSLTPHDAYDFEYFIAMDGEKIPLKYFHKKVYPILMQRNPHALESYIRNNKLCLNRSADTIRIIDFYNRKKESNPPS